MIRGDWALDTQGMNGALELERFGDRLQQRLEQVKQSQAWLADKSGLSTSVLSRLVRCDRLPKLEHVAAMAPVLGTSVDLLVAGTDAEAHIAAASQYVPREHYEAVHQQLVEYEGRKNDLEARLRQALDDVDREKTRRLATQSDLTEKLGQAHLDLDRARRDFAEAKEQNRHYQAALHQAASDVSVLKAKLQEVQAAVNDGTNSSRLAAALAGVAAIGAVTAAAYLARARSVPQQPETPPSSSSTSSRRKRAE